MLLWERPVHFSPSLACLLGLNEALVLQLLHRKVVSEGVTIEGGDARWYVATAEDWGRELPFFSLSTLRRTLRGMRDKGIVQVRRLGPEGNAYRIDYDALNATDQDVPLPVGG
jgi:hypothetical protein